MVALLPSRGEVGVDIPAVEADSQQRFRNRWQCLAPNGASLKMNIICSGPGPLRTPLPSPWAAQRRCVQSSPQRVEPSPSSLVLSWYDIRQENFASRMRSS